MALHLLFIRLRSWLYLLKDWRCFFDVTSNAVRNEEKCLRKACFVTTAVISRLFRQIHCFLVSAFRWVRKLLVLEYGKSKCLVSITCFNSEC